MSAGNRYDRISELIRGRAVGRFPSLFFREGINMSRVTHTYRRVLIGAVAATAAAFLVWSNATTGADDKGHTHASHKGLHMTHISTQAEAEALKPGDSIGMACSICKHVMVHTVGKDGSHVKMLTVGNKHTCGACKGNVTVVGTGKGRGKSQQVNHVCSKCGDDAMFVVATKPGSGAGHHHHEAKK